jgi:MoaA/NifB/PqqE/SkfB family radical SAM enzyme
MQGKFESLFNNIMDEKKDNKVKIRLLKGYNTYFCLETGKFARWGETIEEDPEYSPLGPEILDIEVSSICTGINGIPCSFCYKSNNAEGKNMDLDDFIHIINNVNKYDNLQQVALGIGDIDANPDLIPIMRWCNKKNIIPNITVNGANLDKKFENITYYEHLSELCGAVSVSHYDDDICFNAIDKFKSLGMKQVNIHKILAKETLDDCMRIAKLCKKDERLSNLNALIFLSLKNTNSKSTLHYLTSEDDEAYNNLIDYAIQHELSIGFDSCGANRFLNSIKDYEDYDTIAQTVEPCESGLFSYYINVDGIGYPCSFVEQSKMKGDYDFSFDILGCGDFLKYVWFNRKMVVWQDVLLHNCRKCPVFAID